MSTSYTQAPTRKQLAYLRSLAHNTGTTFTLPHTRRHASAQIAALLERPASSQLELALALDIVAVRGGDIPETA